MKNLARNSKFAPALFDNVTACGIIAADAQGNILAFNEGAHQILGYKPGDVIGKKKISDLSSPELNSSGGFDEALEKAFKDGAYSFVDEARTKKGALFPAQFSIKTFDEKDFRVLLTIEDLSEQQALKKELEDARRRLKDLGQEPDTSLSYARNSGTQGLMSQKESAYYCTLGEGSSNGVIFADLDYRILNANRRAATLLGLEEADTAIGKNLLDIVSPKDRRKAKAYLATTIETKEVSTVEFAFDKADDSEFIAEIRVCPVINSDNGETALTGTIRDVTDRVLAEERLRAKRSELTRQNEVLVSFLDIVQVATSSLSFSDMLGKLLPFVGRLAGANYCMTCNMRPEKHGVHPTFQWGLSGTRYGAFMALTTEFTDREILSAAFSDEVQLVSNDKIDDLPEPLRRFLEITETNSIAFVPISHRGKCVVMMGVGFSKHTEFPPGAKELLVRLKGLLDFAFETSREASQLLHETTRLSQHLKMIRALTNISQSSLRSTTKEAVIYEALKHAGKFLNSRIVEILAFDDENQQFTLSGTEKDNEIDIDPEETFIVSELGTWHRIKLGLSTNYSDVANSLPTGNYEKRFFNKGYRSLLIVPLFSEQRLMGLVAFGSEYEAAYSPEQLDLAQNIAEQISITLANRGLIDRLKELLVGVVDSLVTALDAKSAWTQGHSSRVSDYSVKLGKALRFSDERLFDLRIAGLFHDVGKIGTPDNMLDKQAKLTDEEYAQIRSHPHRTFEILAPIPELRKIGEIAMRHHEKWNGGGYPDGLSGEEIPLLSRVICLADAYDAMAADRPYRKGLSVDKIIAEISDQSGSQFDPNLADTFIDLLKNQSIGGSDKERKAA